MEIIKVATDDKIPSIPFFNIGELQIAGCTVQALNHGMSRTQGLELFGPIADAEKVRSALIEAGEGFGLKQAGARAYSISCSRCNY